MMVNAFYFIEHRCFISLQKIVDIDDKIDIFHYVIAFRYINDFFMYNMILCTTWWFLKNVARLMIFIFTQQL